MKITCIDKEMRTVLATGYYKIPRFQRPYSWEIEYVDEFWNDAIVGSSSDYFIGSMVVYRESTDTFGVVDGQQRLTTITMILAAIRNVFTREGLDKLAKGIHGLIERADVSFNALFVLQTETSYPYLQEHIQKFGEPEIMPPLHDEEQLLIRSFEYITNNVELTIKDIKDSRSLAEDDKREEIEKTLTAIRDKILGLKLIFVEVDNEDDAYMIFETLNTRGKDLGVSDLVKNYIARLLRPKNPKVDLPKDKWNTIRLNIEGSQSDIEVNTFLHHFWLSKYDYVTAKDLFKQLKKTIQQDNAKDFLEDLLFDSQIYREINEPSMRAWAIEEASIRNSLEALIMFRLKQPTPMVLSIMREYSKGTLKKKHVENILSAIENFHFIFTAVTSQRSSGGISMMYASSARQLLAANTTQDKVLVLDDLKKKLRTKKPSYSEFEALFSEISYLDTLTKQKKLVQYILKRLDSYFSNGLPVEYNLMTIEHLAPQNPKVAHAPAQSHIGKLGNLILISDELNNKLDNKSFADKKKTLMASRVWIDEHITNASEWSDTEIGRRTLALADTAYNKVWLI